MTFFTFIKNDMNQVEVNSDKNRFEIEESGLLAIIDFQKIPPNILDLVHTEVPKKLTGKGIGSKLVSGALNYCKENNLKVIPSCPFIKAFINKYPAWNDLLARKN